LSAAGRPYNGPVIGAGGKLVYYIAKSTVWVLGKLIFRMRVLDRHNVPATGGVLIACNHVSHLDPPLVGTASPRIAFNMAKKELFKVPALEWFMRKIGTIMVHRGQGRQALLDAIKYIAHGEVVVIFPEGTRSRSGVLSKGHSGAIVIAIRTNCSIVPTVIIGSEKAMTKGSKAIKPVPITIRFGEPYMIQYGGDTEHIPREVLERELVSLMDRIEALLPADQRPAAADKAEWYTPRKEKQLLAEAGPEATA
jgi:1-acyl-sn-glycerol-3-phosphate acyltransferase